MNYIRTDEAITALETRDRILSSKQRQLLILIGSKDFKKISEHAKEKICSSSVFEDLINLGFIKTEKATTVAKPFTTNLTRKKSTEEVITPTSPTIQNHQNEDFSQQYNIELTFENMKQLMTETLIKRCGLMGRSHARHIENSQNLLELKRSHMTVVTLLQESNMPKAELLQFTKTLQRFYQQQNH